MNKVMKTCFASVVSELQQSDIYMTVKARLLETPRANLNGVRVTPAFLAEIVENQEKYVGLPLCADVKALANGRYDHLGHLYDARTGEFHSTQIGSFYKYEQENFEGGSHLIGYARIMKRNKAVCKAIAELFADNALKFSFEITCGSYTELEDGTIEIDASSENFLEGAAIVTFPACEDAVALELVAECNNINMIDDRKDEQEMTDVNESAEVVTEEKVEKPESEEQEEVEAECQKQKEETAQVYVTEEHTETTSVCAYDSETGADVCESVTVSTRSSTVEDGNIIAENNDNDSNTVVAEDDVTEEETDNTIVLDTDTDTKEENKKTAQLITEFMEEIKSLRNEISELKETQKQIASIKKENVGMNPFMAEINTPKKYSLLEKAENTKPSFYSLLDKA